MPACGYLLFLSAELLHGGLPDFLPGKCREFSCDSSTWYVEVVTPGPLNATFFGNGSSRAELVKMSSQRRRAPLTARDRSL